MLKQVISVVCVMALVLGLASIATATPPYQITLSSNANVSSGGTLGGLTKSGGSGTAASPWLYEFTTGGLNLGIYEIQTTNGTSFTLDLGTYDIDGTGTSAFYAQRANITLTNVGNLVVSGTITTADNTYSLDGGDLTINATGIVSIGGNIDTTSWLDGGKGGDVKIGSIGSRVASVSLTGSKIYTFGYTGASYTGEAGDITIYAQDDINIQSGINTLYDWVVNDAAVTLDSADGTITLNNLDLNLLGTTSLTAGSGVSYIEGVLWGLDLNNSGGSGTYLDPFVLTQTQLTLPTGQYLVYDPTATFSDGNLYFGGIANTYLGGYVYQLNGGGLLLTQDDIPGSGAPVSEPTSLGLLGLALLGLRKRRK